MIPTIQLIYGTMPKIEKLAAMNHTYLTYDSEFYLFKFIRRPLRRSKVTYHITKAVQEFLLKKNIYWFCDSSTISFIGKHYREPVEVISLLITDEFYDSYFKIVNDTIQKHGLAYLPV
jgi:hypothetical protein